MKYLLSFLIPLFLFFTVNAQQTIVKKKLNVLYVGGSANWEKAAFKTDADMKQDIARRSASFAEMLNQYFTSVTSVDAQDYTEKMSDNYDVTIFDGTPQTISDRRTETDASGKPVKYIPAGYLTEDFGRPVLFIGELGEKIGRSIGLKADWYCLCLDAYAHNFRKDHAIFKGPFNVNMTVETKPTPEDAFHYQYFSDKKYPKTLPMWRVQTKGYVTDKNFRVGMVARPWGFEDSPDAEYISSGVCSKTLDAVALGRHGNFFHWGFAASPEFMTEESKAVLANAVVYISGFNGKGVIARKYTDRRATREYLKEKKYYASKDAYTMMVDITDKFNNSMSKEKSAAETKKANGEELTDAEKRSLNFKPMTMESYEDFLKKNQGELYPKFGTNTADYVKYYDNNKNYFYSRDELYKILIDEDVKSLGIPYYDKRLLDKCISMLEKKQDEEKAKRILNRYTMVSFNTAAEWRAWFNKYKDKMFFTETGGYYFMINTYDKSIEGNDYKKKALKKSYDNVKTGETSHANAVSVAGGIVDKDLNKKDVVIKLKIHPGYHIYAYVSEKDPYIGTDIKVSVPEGYSLLGEMKMPSFQYYNENKTTIYTDEVMFVQEIEGKGKAEIVYSVRYQCCDDHICFLPENKEYRLRVL